MENDTQQVNTTTQPTIENETPANFADYSRPVEEVPRHDLETVATLSPTVAEIRTTQFIRSEQHQLTLRQIAALFQQAGIPRTHRSIERYCKQGKLDTQFDPQRRIYYVTRASADKLISEMKATVAANEKLNFSDTPAPNAEMSQTISDSVAKENRQLPPLSEKQPRHDATGERLRELQEKLETLEVDKRVRDQLITQLKEQIREDRQHFTQELTGYARLAGNLEERLQLTAPQQSRGVHESIQTTQDKSTGAYTTVVEDLETDEGKEHGK